MKRILLSLVGMSMALAANSQIVFSEDFDGIGGPTAGGAGTYTFPSGWLLRNVDNLTPNTSVAYVNEAWERREDFNFNVTDSAAFSTSWYTPAATSNDWMWTPAINVPANAILKWNGVTYDASYPDGYEVRVMVSPSAPTGGPGVIGNQITNSTSVFSIAAENTAWTARQVSLSAYAGQTIYIGFRNTSVDKFLLLIDDVQVEQQINYNLGITSPSHGEYTILTPDNATTSANIQLRGTVNNSGLMSMTNVALGCDVWVDGAYLTSIQSTTDPSLAAGANVVKTISYTPTVIGDYDFKFYPIATEADLVNANDTIFDPTSFLLTEDYLGRDDGTVVGALGIGAGNGGLLGQVFNIETTTQFEGIDMYFTRGYAGRQLGGVVYNTNGAGVPTTFLAATDTLLYIDDSARLYHLPFNGGLSLSPGKYAFFAIEFNADSTVSLANTNSIFTNATVYVTWPTNPNGAGVFSTVESFGANFAKTFVIRPKVDVCFGETGSSLVATTDADCGISNGSAEIALEPGYSITWEDNTTNPINNALPVGYSTYTVMNANCTFVDSVLIANPSAPSANIVGTQNANCNGDQGSVTIDVTGGTSPYIITWSNGDTGLMLDDVAGTYSATVVDANNCSVIVSNAVITQPAILTTTSSGTGETCGSCNDGTAEVAVTGGVTPYTYLWSPGGETTDSIGGLAPGTYLVFVTDDNGCTSSVAYTVADIDDTGIDELIAIGINVYPNPVVDFLSVESTSQTIEKVTLYDANGKFIATGTNVLDFRKLASGSYQLVIKTDKKVYRTTVIK